MELRLLKNKGFKEKKITKVGFYALGTSTPLASNKSLWNCLDCLAIAGVGWRYTNHPDTCACLAVL